MAKLCLNMIVKNEADKIVRCLESVAPYIDCYAIVDTGSTDETQKTIETFFASQSIPGTVTKVPFVNFEQARNAGLKAARTSPCVFDYIFLLDADMVLEVEDKQFRDKLTDVAYDVIQKAGGLSYFNRRLIRRDQTGEYVGVTHEYLNVPGGSMLHGLHFIDHADGANRKDKFKRDIKLLRAAIKKDPTNSRYVYYLAQSYRDSGLWELAASSYLKRANAGGWDEEAWSARFNYAHALNALGDTSGFIRELLTAYNQRPSRAETLYDLAKYYREKADQQNTSLLYSDPGRKIPYTKDMLFVHDYAYKVGLREEYSICAFYNPDHRQRGYAVCSELAIDPQCTDWSRELARGNLFHYIQPLKELCHSFTPSQINFVPKDGYIPMNPSVVNLAGELTCVLRSVNYTMDEAGRYLIKGTNGEANGTNPIHTRNYLLRLDDALQVKASPEILPPIDWPAPKYDLVVGFEDMRLFERAGEFWTISNVRDQNPEGWCEQHVAKVVIYDEQDGPVVRLAEVLPILPKPRQHEKNWMPWVDGDKLSFVYKLGQAINETGAVWHTAPVPFAVEKLSGGSQVIPFKGGWLALVHESRTRPGDGKRYYQHRFVWWDAAKILRQISIAFVLHDRQIEFAAGLAWHPDKQRIVISYGIRDCEAWLATIDWHDVSELLAGHL